MRKDELIEVCRHAPLFRNLRDTSLLQGKCGDCEFRNICGGGFRVRAVQVHGNFCAPDSACYLTEEEISQPV